MSDASKFFQVGPFGVHAVYLSGRVHAVQVTLPSASGDAHQVRWADVSDAHLLAISEAVHAPVRDA